MSEGMQQMLESKRAMRTRLAALPFSEKITLLEKLRERSLLIAAAAALSPQSRPRAR